MTITSAPRAAGTAPVPAGPGARPAARPRGSRLTHNRWGYAYVAPFFLFFAASASTRSSTPPGSRCTTSTCPTSTRGPGSASRTTASCCPDEFFWNAAAQHPHHRDPVDGAAAVHGPRPGAPAQLQAPRPHLPAGRDPHAVRDEHRRRDPGLRAAVRARLRPHQRGPAGGRHRPGRLGGRPLDQPDRDRAHRDLALDRLQRAHLPRRHAVHPVRAVRGGRSSTAPAGGGSSCTSRCPACGRRSCSPSWCRRSARCSCSASRCCSAATG